MRCGILLVATAVVGAHLDPRDAVTDPKRRRVIVDQDSTGPGTTNTASIALLLCDPNIEVEAITVATGDGWVGPEVAHVLRLLELMNRTDVPVVPGSPGPLLPLTRDEVLGSGLIASPLHRLDCCLFTDGGGADHVCAYSPPPQGSAPADAQEYSMQAQMAQHRQYKALFEGFQFRAWEWYSGVLFWKSQGPWPALRGAWYDWYLAQNGGFWGARGRSRPWARA